MDNVVEQDCSLNEHLIIINQKMEKLLDKYISNPGFELLLKSKYNQQKYNELTPPAYNGGHIAVYGRLIQGKATEEDYAAIHRDLSQKSDERLRQKQEYNQQRKFLHEAEDSALNDLELKELFCYLTGLREYCSLNMMYLINLYEPSE